MAKDSPIQFKGTTLKIIQTQLRTTDFATLHAALGELTGNSPDFFEDELAVLDFSNAEDLPEGADWGQICQLFRSSGLTAVATHGLPEALAAAASAAGLPPLGRDALSRAPRAKPVEPAPTPAPAPAPVAAPQEPAPPAAREAAPSTVTLDKPLRSGQRFYARGSDLIVMAMVSAGAEVIADGNIHVYAPLRGRALAGASGDKTARIFTTSLEAELVSVAGLYRTFEAGVPVELARQPATISLSEEGGEARLTVAPLALR
ncbi:septum site-determining protein MinC [Dechloromonas denitrificans]|uniref:septum site-determining protein MinC n=1 Tax=Dechloromonas denitrificans TaxID=281362 RepID=UPI001CF86CC8|nr:septum site-determining protein MinC [Dechloromonas denitrificans]UCV03963.1 septum site-determining protein MinC [Dechloromonas denitrificans]UCV08219.1 septum site-determining protein MinC [Dechloromonas denitrificans]